LDEYRLLLRGGDNDLRRRRGRPGRQRLRRFLFGQDPHPVDLAARIHRVVDHDVAAAQAGRHLGHIVLVEDARAGRELARFAIHGQIGKVTRRHLAAQGVGGEGAHINVGQRRQGQRQQGAAGQESFHSHSLPQSAASVLLGRPEILPFSVAILS